jgi:exonuclease SbcC
VTPRLKSLRVRDFRSISGEWLVPLDAEVVVIHGQNGAGKTSLLSALELAATGKISYLDRLGDADYLHHLNHRGKPSGEVTLEVTGLVERALGSAVVGRGGVDCTPLLADRLAETFVERCLLPQATLGRLFEVYAPKQNPSDTPLIRFVKEILGLDALDALIEGLYPAGDIRRVQKLSSRWRYTATRVTELSGQSGDVSRALSELRDRLGAAKAELAASVGVDDNSVDDFNLADFEFSQSQSDSKAAAIQSLFMRLEAIETTLIQEDLLSTDPYEALIASDLSVAEDRYEQWRATRARPLVDWYKQNSNDADEPTPAEMLRTLNSSLQDLEASLADVRRKLSESDSLDQQLIESKSLSIELDDAITRLSDERDLVSGSSTAASLASALVSILEYVDGETCPVCDQGFHTDGSLYTHISAKIDDLNADANQLRELEGLRTSLEAQRKAVAAEIADNEAARLRLGALSTLHSDMQELTQKFSDQKALERLGEVGLSLWDNLNRLRDSKSASARRENLLQRCLVDLEDVAGALGAAAPRGLLAQQVASLRAHARGQLDELDVARRNASEAIRRHAEIGSLRKEIERRSNLAANLKGQSSRLSTQIAEATARKQSALELRKDAEQLRAAITTRVFNDQLNGSWSQIFGALVPSEPFIPQFRNDPAELRRVRIDIETRHRDGLEGATPAAMLSQGNLNTAALSLFIALHFAVQPELPWLIFDDPVQSMDDLHISNFAALVKQLTRRNGRQVLIAVHDRELFDYLCLELSPASSGEDLLAIVLDRTYGQSVIRHERLSFNEETAILPHPAA